jgi:hypothetical protein
MPLIMRSSAAFSWLTGSFGFIRFFSDGTWSTRGWRCPIGASGTEFIDGAGSSEFIDGPGAGVGFREPADCAIAAEVSTRASSAIIVIKFRMMGLPSWGPLSQIMVRGNLDHKVRQTSRFVQMIQHSGTPRCPRGSFCGRDSWTPANYR